MPENLLISLIYGFHFYFFSFLILNLLLFRVEKISTLGKIFLSAFCTLPLGYLLHNLWGYWYDWNLENQLSGVTTIEQIIGFQMFLVVYFSFITIAWAIVSFILIKVFPLNNRIKQVMLLYLPVTYILFLAFLCFLIG